MKKEVVKKVHNMSSIALIIIGIILLFTQFLYFGILFIILGILFSLVCRSKPLERSLEMQNPLSISILLFALMGILGFPLTVMYYNVYFKPILIIWIASFVIYYLIILSVLSKLK